MSNRYGLDAVAFRAGTHATFKAAMLDALAADTQRALRTRDDDDFAIALLDAWALAADVLTFYDERTINEFFLRTATDPSSLVELSRLVGYRPRPGLAASTYLAYTIADPPPATGGLTDARGRAPETIPIPTGAKAQNTPAPGTLPQTFETTAALGARLSGNALGVRTALNYVADNGDANPVLYVTGQAAQPGDRVAIVLTGYEHDLEVRPVLSVEPAAGGTTAVRTIASFTDDRDPAAFLSLADPPPWPSGPLSSALLPAVRNHRWEQRDFAALAHANGWPLEDVGELVDRAVAADAPPIRAWTLRSAGNLFGYNAPLWATLSDGFHTAWKTKWPNGWPDDPTVADDPVLGNSGSVSSAVDLDGVATWIVPGRYVRLVGPATTIVARVAQRSEVSRTDYALSAKVTRLHLTVLTPGGNLGALPIRGTTVEAADRELVLAPVPTTRTVGGDTILLDRCIVYVSAGQPLALSGERVDRPGVRDTEIVVPDDVTIDDGRTRLWLTTSPLANRYVASSVRINTNVVPASHGETRSEAIGSGDGSTAFQRFRLSQRPLTWLSAAVPGGIDAALVVRVDGVAWTRVDRFYGHGPSERIYLVDYDSDGYAWVCTGDGITGARVPSGTENVVATYRQGLGAAGLLDAHALTLAVTQPVGVKAVDNPVPATGAADPETLDDARANAAIGLRSLDRIVSLDDYVDFVRASAGIAKADVILIPRGPAAIVVITVAGPGGTPIVPGSRQATDLAAAIDAASAGRAGVMLVPYRPVTFRVAARVAVDPAYDEQSVFAAIETTLRSAFGFANRTFAAPVNAADVIAIVQGVPGVVALALDALYRADGPVANANCTAAPASLTATGQALGAELLTLDPGPLVLGDLP
jgi:predicted phage baseplate assembly protein